MPSKKKKYNARFPAGRIKKIMQTDEEVGKVAQAVPVIISRTLELFVESLLTKSMQITQARNAKTLTPSHMKQCILSESRFDFLKDLVKNIPDASAQEDNENNAMFEASLNSDDVEQVFVDTDSSSTSPGAESSASLYIDQPSSSNRTAVIKYGPKVAQEKNQRTHNSTSKRNKEDKSKQENVPFPIPELVPAASTVTQPIVQPRVPVDSENVPPLIPISSSNYYGSSGDNLCIDEDYDN